MTMRECWRALVVAGLMVQGQSLAVQAGPAAVPVVAELFTSEGCSSCPPADALLRELATNTATPGVNVIVLSEHVDYWDRLGWRDRFSSPLFSARQADYQARVFRAGESYTPQLVIDGRTELIGSERTKVLAAIATAAREPKVPVAVAARDVGPGRRAEIVAEGVMPTGIGSHGPIDLVVAITEDQLVTQVRAGENGGRRLLHSGVVRVLKTASLSLLADRSFRQQTVVPIEKDWDASHLAAVVLLQERAGRRIVGAGRASFGN
jgi:hypothetical protein